METNYRNMRYAATAAAGIIAVALTMMFLLSPAMSDQNRSKVDSVQSRATGLVGFLSKTNDDKRATLSGPAGPVQARTIAVVNVHVKAAPQNKAKTEHVPGELLVKIDDFQTVPSFLVSHGLSLIGDIGDGTYRVSISDKTSIDDKIAEIGSDARAAFAEPNYIRRAALTPNDPDYASRQWAPQKIMAPNAWDVTTGDAGVIVAVVDTGVAYNHPELTGRVINGFDFFNGDSDSLDDEGHGTHVAGIIAAAGNNGAGMAGVAWNTQIMAVKVLDSNGNGFDSDVSSGIRYAADHGAKIINLSLAGSAFSQTLQNAVTYAYNSGAIVIAAAGNNGTSQTNYPAGLTNVMGVGSTGQTDVKSSFSNFNSSVDVTAPGESIYSTYLSPAYFLMSGTSMASPHVAGLAALIKAEHPGWSPLQIEQLIESTADDKGAAGRDNLYGWGRINANSAIAPDVISLTGLAMTPDPYRSADGPLTVNFTLSADSNVFLNVSDPDGTQVRRIGPLAKLAGLNSMTWDGLDDLGRLLPSFWYHLTVYAYNGVTGVSRDELINITEITPLLLSNASAVPVAFNPGSGETAALRSTSNKEAFLAVTIYDARMLPVRRVPFARYPAGTSDLMWDGKDDAGLVVPRGVYTFLIFGSDSNGAGASVSGTVTVE